MKKQIVKTIIAVISIIIWSGVYRWGKYLLDMSYSSLATSQVNDDNAYYQAAKYAESLKSVIGFAYLIVLVLIIIWLISIWVKYARIKNAENTEE